MNDKEYQDFHLEGNSMDFEELFDQPLNDIPVVTIHPTPHPIYGSTFQLPEVEIHCLFCGKSYTAVDVGQELVSLLCPECQVNLDNLIDRNLERWEDV